MDKERFRGLCLEILPLIAGIMKSVKRSGYEEMASLIMEGDDYFSFLAGDTGWGMRKDVGGAIKLYYGYSEEIQPQDHLQEKMTYNKVSDNLVEISLVYASLQAEHEELSNIDSIIWKQMFVQWANEFETGYAGTDWKQDDYLEKIEKFARHKIMEYIGLEVTK